MDKPCPIVALLGTPPFNAGDANGDNLLDPGEAWQYQCVLGPSNALRLTKGDSDLGGAQSPTEPAPVTNVATASGQPPLVGGVTPLPVRSPQRTQIVDVILPRIALDKAVDQPVALAGSLLTYTLTVTNPGDSPMDDVTVFDDRCTVVPSGDPINDGDDDADGALDPGEAWIFTCTAIADARATAPSTSPTPPRCSPVARSPTCTRTSMTPSSVCSTLRSV